MLCVCAEHIGHAAHAGNHSILWGGADTDEARLACWRHCSTGGVVCRRTWHELLLLCSASGHLRHVVVSVIGNVCKVLTILVNLLMWDKHSSKPSSRNISSHDTLYGALLAKCMLPVIGSTCGVPSGCGQTACMHAVARYTSHGLLAGNVHAWQTLALSVPFSYAGAYAVPTAIPLIKCCASLEACLMHALSATSAQMLLGFDTDELRLSA